MKIKVHAYPSETGLRTFEYDLEDIGVTEKEWNKMSFDERQFAIQKIIDDEPEQPYWYVDQFEIR